MKSVLVTTSLMAAMALSKPLEKRYYVTETDTYTVTVTETGGWAPGPTEAWGQWGQSVDPVTTSSTTASADPTDTWSNWGQSVDPVTTSSTTASADPTDTWSNWGQSVNPTTTTSWTSEAPASTSTSTPAAVGWSSAPAAASSSAPNSYAQAILDQHNNHRQNHSAQALVWDDNMANIAQQIAESCVYAHNT